MTNFCEIFVFLTLLFILPLKSYCFYGNSSNIYELNVENFDSLVINSNEIWIVQFYVTQSTYCKKFIVEYEKAGKALKGFVKLGAFNIAKSIDLIQKYNINEYPTIKIFNHEKDGIFDYSFNKEHTAQGIILDAMKAIRKRVDDGLKNKLMNVNENIVQLHDDNFEKNVLNTEDVWLIVFYDVDDKMDVELLLNDLNVEMNKPVKLGAVASENLYTRSTFDINELPTIIFLPFGVHTKKMPSQYDGLLAKEYVIEFIEKEYAKMPSIKPNGIAEINDEDTLYGLCDKTNLCIVIFLPELKTFSHPRRELYYAMFKEMLDTYKYTRWVWIWCQYGTIPNLEVVLGVDETDEPIVSALEMQHSSHSLLKGPFTRVQLKEFLENARIGAVEEDHVFVDDIYSDSYNKDEL